MNRVEFTVAAFIWPGKGRTIIFHSPMCITIDSLLLATCTSSSPAQHIRTHTHLRTRTRSTVIKAIATRRSELSQSVTWNLSAARLARRVLRSYSYLSDHLIDARKAFPFCRRSKIKTMANVRELMTIAIVLLIGAVQAPNPPRTVGHGKQSALNAIKISNTKGTYIVWRVEWFV